MAVDWIFVLVQHLSRLTFRYADAKHQIHLMVQRAQVIVQQNGVVLFSAVQKFQKSLELSFIELQTRERFLNRS